MRSISPVFTSEQIPYEKIVALDQEEYLAICALTLDFIINGKVRPNSGAAVRFELTEEERKLIAEGGDLIFTEITFGNPFTPINVQICKRGEIPTY